MGKENTPFFKDRYRFPEGVEVSGSLLEPMPERIRPMIPVESPKPFNEESWVFEIKWEGYRMQAYISHGGFKALSRHGFPMRHDVSAIAQELTTIPYDVVLDGELVGINKQGEIDFPALHDFSRSISLLYVAFDILHADGYNLRPLPWWQRRKVLEDMVARQTRVIVTPYVQKEGVRLFQHTIIPHDLEGMVAKTVDSPYLAGKESYHWLKVKHFDRIDWKYKIYKDAEGNAKNSFHQSSRARKQRSKGKKGFKLPEFDVF